MQKPDTKGDSLKDKRLTFNYTNKWYIHESESVPENDVRKIFEDFEI